MTPCIYLGSILHFPSITDSPDENFAYFERGALVTRNGKVVDVGDKASITLKYPDATVVDYTGKLIVPGFIDAHLHFPQTEMIASYGEQLLEWLENYTFPTEQKFSDKSYAERIADIFLKQLYRNGTTTAMVYSTVHKEACDALFEAATAHNMMMIAGKVCMDRHCPEPLRDTPSQAQKDSDELIQRWHGKGRNLYALTPRFAPTSSPEQMAALGELAASYPDVFIQTHLSENKNEIEWVKSLYPNHIDYLDVYDHYGMVRPRAVYGHCLHLSEREWQRFNESGAVAAFCPTSNLFLGSGLFDLETAKGHNVNLALATDVGAGTSFSMLRTMGEAYKVCQLRHTKLSSLQGLYMMTMGAAASLQLTESIGNLNKGTDADFVVLDPHFDSLTQLRLEGGTSSPQDILFALSMLGDDRAVHATYVSGKEVKNQQE
ncbi:guanine deaminase [Aestuariibacter sp. AA17]|uniref:Guanine deaminase n=1 Tax=Fluctibacter corallii TaxID=2984329 RepID=A0ABT3A6L1_9ALTE|nr:guanine deaminase [Aestuariibacter sp. AA17]MCV2884233.1 guanine deaminase [Aestuariibacter sp. AA17]